ncbi:ATP cone domain-containing protein [Maribellus mangrovi]|uniref:ATP cone domain-containing protein n=1 Tax=Maribellus mangrovi TaxID=3133146 RepID=UPI0030EC1333
MQNKHFVRKASGETEPFSQEKLENSLRKAGASEANISFIVNDIVNWLYEGVTTQKIYTRAFKLLRQKRGSLAARYKLKKAIMELGPTGYPFEHFVGELMKAEGYKVKTGQLIQGICVQHEVDVVATNSNTQCLMECKYHNSADKISNVQVPLYIRSRMNDIIERRKNDPEYEDLEFEGWVVTNTRFSEDATTYGMCSGLKMLSWDFPKNSGLKDRIEKHHLFPITSLTQLTHKQKQALMEAGVVLCRQILANRHELDKLGLTSTKHKRLMEEVEALTLQNS